MMQNFEGNWYGSDRRLGKNLIRIRIGIASQISKLNFDYAIVMLRFYKKIYVVHQLYVVAGATKIVFATACPDLAGDYTDIHG